MLETNLKQLRAERGMDQAELAALVSRFSNNYFYR